MTIGGFSVAMMPRVLAADRPLGAGSISPAAQNGKPPAVEERTLDFVTCRALIAKQASTLTRPSRVAPRRSRRNHGRAKRTGYRHRRGGAHGGRLVQRRLRQHTRP